MACKATVIAVCTMALLLFAVPALAQLSPFGFGFPGQGFGFPGMGGFGFPGVSAGYPGYYGYPGPYGSPGYNAFGADNSGLNLCINMPGIGSISFGGFNAGLGAVGC